MVNATAKWEVELERWLRPFLDRLRHKARRRMCPLYISGLNGPGDRKSVQPMAERLAPGDYDQLHHFVAAGVWDAAPLEAELLIQADRIGMEACVGAHHLSRKLQALGHDARLMAAKYVRPYSARKINRNDLRRELYLVPFAVQLKDAPNTFAIRCRGLRTELMVRTEGTWRASYTTTPCMAIRRLLNCTGR
jgi:hypothetical protein